MQKFFRFSGKMFHFVNIHLVQVGEKPNNMSVRGKKRQLLSVSSVTQKGTLKTVFLEASAKHDSATQLSH